MRLGSQARGRAHPWLRVTLNLGVAGALLYSLREVLKRRTNVRARKNSIRAAGDRILQLPRPATTDAETSVGAATSPASDSVNDQAAQNILVRGLIHSEAQAGLATNNWTRILFPGWDVFLFVTLFVGAMLLALVIMPKPASVERLPLEAPAVESDAEDQQGRPLYLSNLKLYESHGGVNLQPAEKRFLDKSNDIFIEIAGRLKSEVTSPGKVRVSIDLPKYAGVVARCANRFETEFSPADCHIEDRSLVISGAVTPQSDGFVVVARVIGIPGVWLSATSAHADARLPLIYDQHRNMGSAEQSAFPVSIQFDIPEAPKWSWSGICQKSDQPMSLGITQSMLNPPSHQTASPRQLVACEMMSSTPTPIRYSSPECCSAWPAGRYSLLSKAVWQSSNAHRISGELPGRQEASRAARFWNPHRGRIYG